MQKLSVILLSKNRQHIIADCLSSLKFADEVIVVDDYSEDNTVNVCKKFGCRVFQNKFRDFEQQTNFALSKARNEWVFWLDADQIVSRDLEAGIKSALKDNLGFDAFEVKGQTIFLGKLTKFGGETCYLTRLFKKSKTRFEGKIHEHALVCGKVGKVGGVLLHYQYRDISELFEKVNTYSSIEAKLLLEKGERFNLLPLLLAPIASFGYRYFLLLGFLDGYRGLVLAVGAFLYKFLMYAKLLDPNLKC